MKWAHAILLFLAGTSTLYDAAALAAPAPMSALPGASNQQPIEVSSDKLDVFQAEQRAVFSGNVIAVQGTTQMRATTMTVFYREAASGKPSTTPPANAMPSAGDGSAAPPAPKVPTQGIYRIEADGKVVFATPTETALGDKAIYDVDSDTIDVFGSDVTLTRGGNVLKGNKLNYNMTTKRSVLVGGATGGTASGKPARVHGLFLPNAKDAPASSPATGSKAPATSTPAGHP